MNMDSCKISLSNNVDKSGALVALRLPYDSYRMSLLEPNVKRAPDIFLFLEIKLTNFRNYHESMLDTNTE